MKNPQDLFGRSRRNGRGRRVGLGVLFAAFVVAISVFRGVAVFYTDFLWFDSVNLTSVWSGLLGTKVLLSFLSILFFFVLIWLNLWLVDKFAPRSLTFNPEDELARRVQDFVRPRVTRVRTGVALVLAVFAGAGFSARWSEWLLFINGGTVGTKDPQFNMDLGFFMFKLPFLNSVLNWVFYALIFTVIISLVAHYLQGAIRPQATSNRITAAVKAHISILFGLVALVRAAHYYLERYELSYSNRGPVSGASYTDVNYLLPALLLLVGISILAAVMFFVGSRRKGWSLPVITVALWAVVSLVVGVAIPEAVQKLSVVPAESSKEAPFIKRNIESTRAAMNLQNIEVKDFKYDPNLTAEGLQANAQTVRNVRLWDPELVKPVYQRLQENRSFFKFEDVDVDRYTIANQATQMELSVRELNVGQLPGDRRSWVNEHLQYTHGYGAVISPANAVTSSGNPDFALKDVPPVGQPTLTRPQVYFGEHTSDYSIVNTDQAEVDYVAVSGRDELSKYEGVGGVELNSPIKKAAFAARVGDLKPLISGLVKDKSKAMYLTNIRERTLKAAPFLHLDNDPYPIIQDGRILWMQDAYTTSNSYPYAQPADTSQVEPSIGGLRGMPFNYVRNSVKITTDAYDGTMKFYVFDNTDPVVKAWQKAFPKLFIEGSVMPTNVREHVRYPEDMFRVQSMMYTTYHMDNPQDFYSKSDRWNIAQKPQFGQVATGGAEDRIEPYYLLMKLPGDTKESFLMFQPFVPYSAGDQRKELSAFLTAKSDGADYGKMQAFVMPRDQQIDGPALVEARVQQDPNIKQYITLLNQSGSTVKLGNMLIIPIENSLMYIRPLYITSNQTSVPEFKKAIVVQGDKIAMKDTLQEALTSLFGSAPTTLEQSRTQGSTPVGAGTIGDGSSVTTSTTQPPAGSTGSQPPVSLPPDQVDKLLGEASKEYSLADEALRNGDLAGYQDHVKKMANFLNQAKGTG